METKKLETEGIKWNGDVASGVSSANIVVVVLEPISPEHKPHIKQFQ